MKYIGYITGYNTYITGDRVPIPSEGQISTQHRATYARDKKTGKYNVRVVGPFANEFAGETVPVMTKGGVKHEEKLLTVVWAGLDVDPETKKPTGTNAALYTFEAQPKDEVTKPTF